MAKPFPNIVAHWQRHVLVPISAREFFAHLERELRALNIDALDVDLVVVNDGIPVLQARREVLRIRDRGGEFAFDLIIAPYSNGVTIALFTGGQEYGHVGNVLAEREVGKWLLSAFRPRTYRYLSHHVKAVRDLVTSTVEKAVEDVCATSAETLSEPTRRPFLNLWDTEDE